MECIQLDRVVSILVEKTLIVCLGLCINPAMGTHGLKISSKVHHDNLPRGGLPNATTLV